MTTGKITLSGDGRVILSHRYDDKKHRKALYSVFEKLGQIDHPHGFITITPDVAETFDIETIAGITRHNLTK